MVALVVTAIVLPNPPRRVSHVIDYLVTLLLAGAATSLVLLFVLVERRAAEPVLPLRLFRSRVFTVDSLVGFVVGFAMFGAITYLPQYMQVVRGQSPTESGLQLFATRI